ncbi:hypothetical protein SUGI_1119500 [Cryptomeria japonica]|nr:hypothetical protein SUGI_1119500 [Cryptomeria japonica]
MLPIPEGDDALAVKLITIVKQGIRRKKEEPPAAEEVDGSKLQNNNCKSEFLEIYGEYYGYPRGNNSIEELRATEFKRLNEAIYLDHAGATLYSESQMQAIASDLTTNIYGNPHSQNDSSVASSDIISSAREKVLAYCNASPKDYKCIFTSGATAALKLVGETFPWSSSSNYMYTMENHNSVLGIREYALNQGATAIAVDIEDMNWDSINQESEFGCNRLPNFKFHSQQRRSKQQSQNEMLNKDVYHLFAFPLECNFSGARFNLNLVKTIQEGRHVEGMESAAICRGRYMVLLDAAKGCGTQPPDLSKFPADFVALSFYKIFGYPTGLGALIVRIDSAQKLQKSYFGGGTVAASIADIDFVRKRERLEEWLEDGTSSFLSIAALQHGFNIINQLGISEIARHTGSLTAYTSSMLEALRHSNGAPVCVLYGKHSFKGYQGLSCAQGPVVTFNMKRLDSSWVGYREVEKLASIRGIQLRTGCFCNPGACSKYLELTNIDMQSNFESGHVCWDDNDIICGRPTGAVRVSFGYMSTFEEVQAFISFIDEFFVSKTSSFEIGQMSKGSIVPTLAKGSSRTIATEEKIYLDSIIVYPIKSCAGFNVEAWPLSETGLLYDREWLVKSVFGEVLTQKKVPSMCLIKTFIDRAKGKLFVSSPNCEERLQILLEEDTYCSYKEDLRLCGYRSQGKGYGAEVNEWFSKALGCPCNLIRRESNGLSGCVEARYGSKMRSRDMLPNGNVGKELSFVNDGQLLLVSNSSVRDLNNILQSRKKIEGVTENKVALTRIEVDTMRFRPNLVISGAKPYAEDEWQAVTIGKEYFAVLGGCNRCRMINFDPETGISSKNEPLATLASYRRMKGKILFGILLMHEKQTSARNAILGDSVDDTENYEDKMLLKVGDLVISA